MNQRTIKRLGVYWDDQDPGNKGWAWRVEYTDGHEETGPWEDERSGDPDADMADMVLDLCRRHGIEADPDRVWSAVERVRPFAWHEVR